MAKLTSRLKRYLYSTLWVIGIGAGIGIPAEVATAETPQQAQADKRLIEEACRDALRKNTIEALEEFLRKYPESDTACQALAYDALNNFSQGPGRERDIDDGGGTGGEGYGGG